MKKQGLLIVFVKNPVPGKVKTRLAKTIGDKNAYLVYLKLLEHTAHVVKQIRGMDVNIYFTDHPDPSNWGNMNASLQQGNDLGERMANAFQEGFQKGYERVVCIGTDLPDLCTELIYQANDVLVSNHLVIGPASDGGYYLLGMNQFFPFIFENKSWSTDALLEETLMDIRLVNLDVFLLEELNDIDTIEDLKASRFNFLVSEKN